MLAPPGEELRLVGQVVCLKLGGSHWERVVCQKEFGAVLKEAKPGMSCALQGFRKLP
jgi:hypothetical protein